MPTTLERNDSLTEVTSACGLPAKGSSLGQGAEEAEANSSPFPAQGLIGCKAVGTLVGEEGGQLVRWREIGTEDQSLQAFDDEAGAGPMPASVRAHLTGLIPDVEGQT